MSWLWAIRGRVPPTANARGMPHIGGLSAGPLELAQQPLEPPILLVPVLPVVDPPVAVGAQRGDRLGIVGAASGEAPGWWGSRRGDWSGRLNAARSWRT